VTQLGLYQKVDCRSGSSETRKEILNLHFGILKQTRHLEVILGFERAQKPAGITHVFQITV
jgi:hypothetical protein